MNSSRRSLPSLTSLPKLLFLTLLLAACSGGGAVGSPASAVETYLQALISVDEVGAVNASCSAWEAQARLEAAAYQGVQTQLENLECSLLEQEGDSALVSCTGQVRYSYAGGEDQLDELGGRVFSAVVDGGEWKMCGLASNSQLAEAQATATAQPPEPATSTPAAPTPQYTATPDTRPLPADWRSWPIIPEPSEWLGQVYAAGLAQGSNPQHFSVAGDCQNIPEAFMGVYDIPERFSFPTNDQYLLETVSHFTGSFNRDGLAVDGGYNFPAIFTPLRADPAECENGEDPLACEIRTWQPSFIFISMEFVYEGRTAENYEQYLRQAVDYALQHNVIPILLTKADNVEGGHAINEATARVAYEYDIPLVNWWRAAQPLPNHGLDLDRDKGLRPPDFHITYEAWSVRSYVGLKTLDTLRQSLIDWGVEAP
ncbi:MAG TPA: hypothetical protein PLC52_09795 [Anaerolineales bacterium]|nr:hypothetical protein [Anaerolineales bacterium]HRQ93143.1 hypothetical protein [Anaerolineales bacterium]